MRTGLIVPISNDALGIAFLLAIVFVIIAGIFKIIQKATFVERESIKFADQSAPPTTSASSFQAEFTEKPEEVDFSNLSLPGVQDASSFFTQLAPRARLNVEINRAKNTLLFSNSESKRHRLVVAITGSGRYATAYYATDQQKLAFEPRLTCKVKEVSFDFKSSAESLIFRDQGVSFYEISIAALTAMGDAPSSNFDISVNGFIENVGGQEAERMTKMAQLISRIATLRSDIIFLGN